MITSSFAPTSRQSLGNIRGFGKKKLPQYAEAIVRIVTTFYDQSEQKTTDETDTSSGDGS